MNTRRGSVADARAVAEVHVQSWRAAYRDLVPQSYLDTLSVDSREKFWREAMERESPELWVAETDGGVVGWVAFGPSRDPDAAGSTDRSHARSLRLAIWREIALHIDVRKRRVFAHRIGYSGAMSLDADICYRAVRAKDRRFDGRFFVAVSSTKIYCRPICPVRPPKRENMRFYSSAAAAEGAGYRPCLRCRPERAPGLAPVDAASRLVSAAIAGIEEHALSTSHVGELAASLGVSDRHLRRVTEAELGVSPIELAQTQRLLLAKRLLSETGLSLTEIAFASGFGSVRRFNALFKSRYGLSPRSLRGPDNVAGLCCQLDFRPPLAWGHLLSYLRTRAVPGVEHVDDAHYRRTVAIDEHQGWIAVSLAKNGTALDVELSQSLAPVIGAVISRVKQLFDLGAAPDSVTALLSQDSILASTVKKLPGLRVPGAFDGFELGVRAILGQQVSVKAATTVAGRWALAFGAPIVTPFADLKCLAPTALRMTDVSESEIAGLGVVGSRARSIIALAKAVGERRVVLAPSADVDTQIHELQKLPGVGPWTAHYIAMRALHWPDAFPGTDLMLLRAANLNAKQLQARAERWRPWRAYATHYLWQSLGVIP